VKKHHIIGVKKEVNNVERTWVKVLCQNKTNCRYYKQPKLSLTKSYSHSTLCPKIDRLTFTVRISKHAFTASLHHQTTK